MRTGMIPGTITRHHEFIDCQGIALCDHVGALVKHDIATTLFDSASHLRTAYGK